MYDMQSKLVVREYCCRQTGNIIADRQGILLQTNREYYCRQTGNIIVDKQGILLQANRE